MSNSGDKTNPFHNPFAVNTTDKDKASVPIFGSTSNSGHNLFSVNSNGNASTSAFGNMTNSIHNPFAVNTTGNASMPGFGNPNNSAPSPFAVNMTGNASTSGFGNMTSSTHNLFAVNTTSNASSMSVSGIPNNSATNPFATNTNGNASLSTFGNMTNATHNPFAVNLPGNASVSVFGNPSNPAPNPFANNANGNASKSVFGNPSNPTPNPFALNTNGNASISVFGNPSNPPPNPFALNTNGNASISVFGNPSNPPPNPFAVKPPENPPMPMFGNRNNSTCNPFAGNTFGNTTSPSSPFRAITFDGTSTGAFGVPPSSAVTPPSIFGVPAAPTETSGKPAAFTNHMSNNAFRWGPGGSAPSPFSQSSGLKFGQSSNALFGTKGLMTSTSAGTNTSVSNAGPFSLGSTKPCSSPPFSFGVTQASTGLNKGSKIKPYAATKNAENITERFLSISSMPVYESKCHEELRWEDYELKSGGTSSLQSRSNTVSTGLLFSPVSQFPISDITPTTSNPFSPSPIPSLNFTPSNPTTAASLSNSAPSSTTTPVFHFPSSPFQTPSFPIQDPSSNSTPSTNITSVFNQPPSSVLNTSFPSVTPLSPSIQPLKPTESGNSILNTSFATPTPSFNSSFPTPTPSFNSTAPSLIQPSTLNPWAFTQPSTLTETGKSQINPAPSALASYNSPGNHGGLTDKAVDCIIAVKDPFGPQSVSSHALTDHRICSPLIQNGISCMPVIDKPATTRISSLITSRHIPQRPLTVRARKYNPKSDGPKVPFFDHIDETPSIQKESTFILPRENPRSVFEATPKLSGVSCVEADVTDASTSLQDGRLKSKTDEATSSTPCNLECQKSVNQKWQQVTPSASVPKLHRPDYYTQPSIRELLSAESNDPGFCSHVQDFVVGRHGYGEVKFEGETDVGGLDLDALVYFNKREVIVYEDEHEKPEIGEGLNKRAEVTLLNVKCSDKTGKEYKSGKMADKFLEKLKKVAEDQGAEFVSYDAVNGVWKFQVQHF